MTIDLSLMTDTIATHSRQLATIADGHLELPIEHCPAWTMEDLLRHLLEVHGFWAAIVDGRLSEPPGAEPVRSVDRDALVGQFLMGAEHLVEVLRAADQSAAVWTWTPIQRDVAFVTRHQVQETVVHHWDGAHALGRSIDIDSSVASDAIEEFLTFSMSTEADPADPVRPALDGALTLVCTDIDRAWTVRDGRVPGTVRFSASVDDAAVRLQAPSSQLLLWLYSRVAIESDARASALGARLQSLSFTD